MNDISRKEKNHRRKVEDQNMVRKLQQRRKKKTPESKRFKHKKTQFLPNKEKGDEKN